MASPSQIPGHQQVAAVDSNGNAFASGATFYLSNVCSSGKQILTFDSSAQEAVTGQVQDVADRRWMVEYEGGNRSKIALKNAARGGYLAATGPGYGSKMWLSDSPRWWFVYQGAKPNTFWLGTTQSKDAFLHTWDSSAKDQTKVLLFTNQDKSAGRYYGAKYSAFEELTAGLSWSLLQAPPEKQPDAPPPEKPQADAAEKAPSSSAADKPTAEPQVTSKPAYPGDDNDAAAKAAAAAADDLSRREGAVAAREQAVAAREEQSKAREAEQQQQRDELAAREEKAAAAEKRLKKAKGNSGPADLLAAMQEADKLRDELAQLRDASQRENGELRAQIAQLRESGGAGAGAGAAPPPASIAKRPLRKPEKLTPPTLPPKKATPARAVPAGFTPDLAKKMHAGKKALEALRERRPPQSSVAV